jgi:hypothetical protein
MELIDARFVDVSAFLIVTPGPTWRLSPAMPWAAGDCLARRVSQVLLTSAHVALQ